MSETKDKAHQILMGLMTRYRLPPMKAMVMIALYNQFPLRYRMRPGMYFRPDERMLTKALRMKLPVYYHLLAGLIAGGFVERQKAKPWGYEYRIMFDKLAPLVESASDGKESD